MKNTLLRTIFLNNKLHYFIIVLFVLLCSFIQIVISMSYRYIVDYANLNNIFQIAVFFVALWIFKFVITSIMKLLGVKVELKSKRIFTNMFITRLFNERYVDLEANGNDFYSTVYLRDVENVSSYTSKIFIPIILGMSSFIFAIGIGVYLSFSITLLILLLSLISVYITNLYKKSLVISGETKMHKHEILNKLSMSLKSNQITIHVAKCQEYAKDLIMKSWNGFRKEEEKYINISAKSRSMNFGAGLIANTLWMIVALYMVYLGSLSIGSFLVFMSLSSIYNWPFFELPLVNTEKYQIENSYKKISEYHFDNTAIDGIRKKETFENIELIDLVYQYEGANHTIQFPNIKINAGDWISIQGHSGAGKTTLSKILLGLYKSNSGIIKINDQIINGKISDAVIFGYLPQNISIFLNENLAYNINFNEQALTENQKQVIISDIFGDFMNSTQLREHADKFSGGELKYLGILRALSKNVDILILDEFSAGLDQNRVDKILDMLSLMNTTIIFITHDARIIHKCKRSLVLNGKHNDSRLL